MCVCVCGEVNDFHINRRIDDRQMSSTHHQDTLQFHINKDIERKKNAQSKCYL